MNRKSSNTGCRLVIKRPTPPQNPFSAQNAVKAIKIPEVETLLCGGEYDGMRVLTNLQSPTLTYASQKDPSLKLTYRRIELEDKMGMKEVFYVLSSLTDMQALIMIVKGYKRQ